MAKRGRPKKEKFAALDDNWKADMMKLDEPGIRKTISECAMNIGIFAAGEKEDLHLKELKEQVKDAGAVYKEGKQSNAEKIGFLKEVLESRGIAVPSLEDFIKNPGQ